MSEDHTGDLNEAAAPLETETNHSQEAQGHESATPEGKYVPLEALQAEREDRQKLGEELQVMKNHLALLSANSVKKEEVDDADDLMTKGEFKQSVSQIKQQYEASLEELKMGQKHSDYKEVITKYLPEVLKQNPKLGKTLEQSQDYELAYYLAKNSDGYKQGTKEKKVHKDAERIMQNSKNAGSLSSIGGASPLNTAKKYKEMSDDEFAATVNRNMGLR